MRATTGPAPGTYLTPAAQQPLYNHVTASGIIPTLLHHHDGTAQQVDLILTPQQVEAHHATLGRLIAERNKHLAAQHEDTPGAQR